MESQARPSLIAVDQLKPNPWNRKYFNPDGMAELTASIKARGVQDPLTVRPIAPNLIKPGGPTHEISSGHRRWLAAKQAGLKEVPCYVQAMDDNEVQEKNLLMNWAREGLAAIDQAKMLRKIKETDKLNQDQLAKQEGIPRSTVTQLLGFLDLPPALVDSPVAVALGFSDWQELKKVKDTAILEKVCVELANKTLAVKDLKKRLWALTHEGKANNVSDEHQRGVEDPQADLWPAVRDKIDAICQEAWAVVYTPFTFTFKEEWGWAFGIINRNNVTPERLAAWLELLARGIRSTTQQAVPAVADIPVEAGIPRGDVDDEEPTTELAADPQPNVQGTQQALEIFNLFMPRNPQEAKEMGASPLSPRLPSTPAEWAEVDALAPQGPQALYKWMLGEKSYWTKRAAEFTWQDFNAPDPITGCHKVIETLGASPAPNPVVPPQPQAAPPPPAPPPRPQYVNLPDRVPTLEEVYEILRKRGEKL